MEFIDFHTHIYPEAVALKAAESIREFYSLGEKSMTGTAEMLLDQGKAAGVDTFVILPVAIRPERTRHINDFILSQTAQHKEFIGFGTLHAAMDDPAAEAEYILSSGLRGVKMHPDTQVFAIDDPRLFPAYEQLQGQLPVIFHMGDYRFDYSHPARLRHLLTLFPRLQVIAAHFGGYRMHNEGYEYLHDTGCFFDVSSSLMFMEPGEAERYIDRCGAERFVYGSDYPMWDPKVEMERFQSLKLTAGQFEQIANKTAKEILKLK